MTKAMITRIKVNILKRMNEYVLNVVSDEELIMSWLVCGVPDDADEEDYLFIAEDKELWNDCCKIFSKICSYKH